MEDFDRSRRLHFNRDRPHRQVHLHTLIDLMAVRDLLCNFVSVIRVVCIRRYSPNFAAFQSTTDFPHRAREENDTPFDSSASFCMF